MTLEVDNLKDSGTGNTDAVQDIIDGRAKAWATANDAGNISRAFNVSSATELTAGSYRYSLTNAMDNTLYPVIGSPRVSNSTAVFAHSSWSDASTVDVGVHNTNVSLYDTDTCFAAYGTLA